MMVKLQDDIPQFQYFSKEDSIEFYNRIYIMNQIESTTYGHFSKDGRITVSNHFFFYAIFLPISLLRELCLEAQAIC